MKMRTFRFAIVLAGLLFSAVGALAQPSDAQVKKNVSGPDTVSVVLGKPGSKSWDSSFKKWVWTRDFTEKSKTSEPKVFQIITGYASYEVNGGRYTFWRVFTNSSRFEGIPNPSAEDVAALIEKFTVKEIFGATYYPNIVGKLESFGLPEDPKFEWHTMNSVSFDLVAVYTQKLTDAKGGTERGQRTFRIRLYRDNIKSPWQKFLTTSANTWKKL